MALGVRVKPRAQREIERAAEWWAENRPAAVGAIRKDIEAALALLVEEPGIGTKIETARSEVVRRLYLTRVRYFLYYRVRGNFLEVVAFWHSSRETGPSL
ncbi:MAG: type II toxin-antitoxin system RelE/ParE family toxin [Rhodocyclaceae bacterium]|nr:type II toxin-antitoxin system RelE/ParE family toxin [Rhodocyclaceae bacterium]